MVIKNIERKKALIKHIKYNNSKNELINTNEFNKGFNTGWNLAKKHYKKEVYK